jgi:two-component system, OmpR family, sensor histidine kinase VicK
VKAGPKGVHPEDLERCVAYYLDHFRRREAFEVEYRLRRHDGAYRWIFDRGVPFTDDAGAFAGFIGSCVDVDERRRAQQTQQQHSQEQLALARDSRSSATTSVIRSERFCSVQ